MRTVFFLPILIVLLTASFAGCGEDQKRSEAAEKTAREKEKQIQKEIKTLGNHPWAGAYYHGDGLGVNVALSIAPKAGFVFEWHGCLGLYDRNYGSVEEKDRNVLLHCTFANKRKGFQGIAEELVPVDWGRRKYLVPADEIVDFCNEVNSRSEPRKGIHGFFFLRRGDEKKNVSGMPNVPNKYKTYLLTKPIEAEILALGKVKNNTGFDNTKFRKTIVTLNAGKNKGLLPGMELHVVQPDNLVESVKITRVEDNKSEGLMEQLLIGETPSPTTGWKLSTVPRWNRDEPPQK